MRTLDALWERGQKGERGERGPRGGSGLGCILESLVGIAGLVAAFSLGPIDLGRTVYNNIIGDAPALKQKLLDYSRRHTSEASLARELGYRSDAPEQEQIDAQKVSIEDLWDAAEEHAPSWYQRWVWTSLEK